VHGRAWGKDTGTRWKLFLQRADVALARNDLRAAQTAVHTAFLEAAADETWEGLLEAGHAYLRIGMLPGAEEAMETLAHRAYLAALVTAHRQESLDGILRTAGVYAACGQRGTAAQILNLAESMGVSGGGGHAGALLRALRHQLGMNGAGEGSPPPNSS
jgi:hypothetical protein